MTDNIEQYFDRAQSGRIYRNVMDQTEKVLIEQALVHSRGNQLTAAKILGINRNTLRTKMRKLRIEKGRFKV